MTDRKVPVGMRELAPCAPRSGLWRVFSLEFPPIRMGFQRHKALECSLKWHQNPGLGGVSGDSEPSADGQERALQQTGKDMSSQVSSQLSNLD